MIIVIINMLVLALLVTTLGVVIYFVSRFIIKITFMIRPYKARCVYCDVRLSENIKTLSGYMLCYECGTISTWRDHKHAEDNF